MSSTSSLDSYLCAKYWIVKGTFDQGAGVNCEFQEKEVDISVLGAKVTIKIPMIINSEPIKPGDELIVIKKSEPVEEPPNKRFKATAVVPMKKARR
jgi:hypothetical protein